MTESLAWVVAFIFVLFLLIRYRKELLSLLGAVVVMVAGVMFVSHTAEQRAAVDRANVSVDVSYDVALCPRERPLLALIYNGSSRELMRVEWRIAAREAGKAANFTADNLYTNDMALRPGETHGACQELPAFRFNAGSKPDPAALQYSLDYKAVLLDG